MLPDGKLTVGSLFAGIGGFDLGFERAGMRTVWQVEQDHFCRRVLERHFPDAQRFMDVREVGADELGWVDVICGGFPCQDISVAGRGAGIEGERSGLWSEMFRIVGELRPRYVVVENVPALTSRGLDRVLADLASVGFDAEWDCLPASDFGAPHRRDRIWLIAYPGRPAGGVAEHRGRRSGWQSSDPCEPAVVRQINGSGGSEGLAACDRAGDVADPHQERRNGRTRQFRPSWRAESEDSGGRELQDADGGALQPWRVGGRVAQAGGSEWWAVEPPVGRVAHGVPDRLDQLAALGNALVPQIAEWIGRRILSYEQERQLAA